MPDNRLANLRSSPPQQRRTTRAGLNTAADVFAVAIARAQARIAAAEHKDDSGIRPADPGVAQEDQLAYAEPADWFFPVRHLLGAALLQAGKAADAETVYRADLRRNPENGWALYGLALSLTAQKRDAEAESVRQRFATAWKDADIALTASAF